GLARSAPWDGDQAHGDKARGPDHPYDGSGMFGASRAVAGPFSRGRRSQDGVSRAARDPHPQKSARGFSLAGVADGHGSDWLSVHFLSRASGTRPLRTIGATPALLPWPAVSRIMSGASASCSGTTWRLCLGWNHHDAGHDQCRPPNTPDQLNSHVGLHSFGLCSGYARAFYARPPVNDSVGEFKNQLRFEDERWIF